MPIDDTMSRRRLLKASAATVTATGLMSSASALDPGGDVEVATDNTPAVVGQAPCLDLGDVTMDTTYGVPSRSTGIQPGSMLFTTFPEGPTTAGCTANFVWEDCRGDLYIGAAGHCFLPGDAVATDNTASDEERRNGETYDPSGLTVTVCADCTFGGATALSVVKGPVIELGEVVYARQVERNGTEGPGHDFGLVRIPSDKRELVDPSLPQWDGPNGVSNDAIELGLPVNFYGSGVANGEVYPTKGRIGDSLGGGTDGNIWYGVLRSTPGDSGGPLIGALGTGKEAGGILTHLTTSGVAGTTMSQCKKMVRRGIGLDIDVALAP